MRFLVILEEHGAVTPLSYARGYDVSDAYDACRNSEDVACHVFVPAPRLGNWERVDLPAKYRELREGELDA